MSTYIAELGNTVPGFKTELKMDEDKIFMRVNGGTGLVRINCCIYSSVCVDWVPIYPPEAVSDDS